MRLCTQAEKEDGWMKIPQITQDGRDGDQEDGYILNMRDSATAGFKYFDCRGIKKVSIKVRDIAGSF